MAASYRCVDRQTTALLCLCALASPAWADGNTRVANVLQYASPLPQQPQEAQTERQAAGTVRATSPQAPCDESAQSKVSRGHARYVEDGPVNVILVKAIPEHWYGLELVSALDVETGVRTVLALRPDLMLPNMHLGTASGHDFLARVRSDPRTVALQVVALSASAMRKEIKAARQAGVMDCWTKPLDAEKFRAGVSRLLSGSD